MGASTYTIAIIGLQDFQAKVGVGGYFDLGGLTMNYGYMSDIPAASVGGVCVSRSRLVSA